MWIRKFFVNVSGAMLLEYALIAGLVAIVIAGGVKALGA